MTYAGEAIFCGRNTLRPKNIVPPQQKFTSTSVKILRHWGEKYK